MVETKVNTIFWVFPKVTCDEVSKKSIHTIYDFFNIMKIIYLIGSW